MRNLVFGERFSETASGFGDFETYVNKVMENGRTYQSLHDSLQGMSFGQEVQVRNLIEETIEESGKSVSRQTLESIKTKIVQMLRAKLPGQTTDKGYWSVAYLLQTSDGYLRGLGEAGKDIAKKLYSRSSSKDKFGFINARTLITNQKIPGIAFKGNISIGGYQPPRNKMTVKELIKIIFAYSPRKNSANDIDEYSTK